MIPKRKYTGVIPIRTRTVPGGTARPTGGTYPGAIPIRQRTVPGGTARATGGRYPGAPTGTIRASATLRPRPTVSIMPRPTVTMTARPTTSIMPARPTAAASLLSPAGQYPGAIPMVGTGPVTAATNGTGVGLPAIGTNALAGIGNIGSSISTGVGGMLSVGRSYAPLAIKVVAGLVIVKIALWIFGRRR